MKIAQVAPLMESVPPRLYGGTERIVSYLTEELVRLGHDVTLFASADSITSAELAPCCTRALRLDPTVRDIIPHFTLMIDKVRELFGREPRKDVNPDEAVAVGAAAVRTAAGPRAMMPARKRRTMTISP